MKILIVTQLLVVYNQILVHIIFHIVAMLHVHHQVLVEIQYNLQLLHMLVVVIILHHHSQIFHKHVIGRILVLQEIITILNLYLVILKDLEIVLKVVTH